MVKNDLLVAQSSNLLLVLILLDVSEPNEDRDYLCFHHSLYLLWIKVKSVILS